MMRGDVRLGFELDGGASSKGAGAEADGSVRIFFVGCCSLSSEAEEATEEESSDMASLNGLADRQNGAKGCQGDRSKQQRQ